MERVLPLCACQQNPEDPERSSDPAAQRTSSLAAGGRSDRVRGAELQPAVGGSLHAEERQVGPPLP